MRTLCARYLYRTPYWCQSTSAPISTRRFVIAHTLTSTWRAVQQLRWVHQRAFSTQSPRYHNADTHTDYVKSVFPHLTANIDAFHAQVGRSQPDQVAVLYQEQRLTYHELDIRASALALRLFDMGVRPLDCVGSLLRRGPDIVVTMVAIAKLGAVYVPLDETYPSLHLQHYARTTQLKYLVCHSDTLPLLGEFKGHPCVLDQEHAYLNPGHSQRAPHVHAALESARQTVALTDPALIVFTSGSTGTPKPIIVSHMALAAANRLVAESGVTQGMRTWICPTATSFTVSSMELWSALTAGMRAVIPSPCRLEPYWFKEVATLIDTHQGEIMYAVPAIWRGLFRNGWTGSSNFTAVSLGEKPQSSDVRMLVDRVGRAYNSYGSSEAAQATWYRLSHADEPFEQVPVGPPSKGVIARILDSQLREVPPGQVGQLYVGGATVASGYLGMPELTAQKFIPLDPARPAKGHMFASGDLAQWDERGNLVLKGRADDQINLQGLKIDPVAVERAILALGCKVQSAVVLARDEHLLACVEPRLSPQDIHRIQQQLLQVLPNYHIPTLWLTLDAGRMPRTPNGKISKTSMRLMPQSDFIVADSILYRGTAE